MIQIKNNVIDYYGNPAGYLQDKLAVIDCNFKCAELESWVVQNKFESEYQEGVFDNLSANPKYYDVEALGALKNVRIWQIKSEEGRYCRFESYENFCEIRGDPSIEIYDEVYDCKLRTNNLDEIFDVGNTAQLSSFDFAEEISSKKAKSL